MQAIIYHAKQNSRFVLERHGDRSVTIKLRPGRNTELTLDRDLVAPPAIRNALKGKLLETFAGTTHFRRLMLAALITLETARVKPTATPAAKDNRPPLRTEEDIDRILAGGTKPIPGDTPPPPPPGDDDDGNGNTDDVLPWSKSMNRGELAAAYVSRGEDPAEMTRAQLLEALAAWDATNDSSEDESADGRSAS